jgi:hypothetical protein
LAKAPTIRCEQCEDVIGVYEPVILLLDGEARETSRAAEPSLVLETRERYHLACYLERLASPSGRSVAS